MGFPIKKGNQPQQGSGSAGNKPQGAGFILLILALVILSGARLDGFR